MWVNPSSWLNRAYCSFSGWWFEAVEGMQRNGGAKTGYNAQSINGLSLLSHETSSSPQIALTWGAGVHPHRVLTVLTGPPSSPLSLSKAPLLSFQMLTIYKLSAFQMSPSSRARPSVPTDPTACCLHLSSCHFFLNLLLKHLGFCLFLDGVSLCNSSGCFGTCFVGQASL